MRHISGERFGFFHRTAMLFVVLGLLPLAGPVLAEEVPHHPANLSFFFPISTNQDPTISTNFRLNLLYGRVGYIRGFDIGTIVSRTDRDVRGIQLTGVYSHTGQDLRGAVFTLGLNYTGGDTRGIQAAGLVNFNRGWMRGVQYATFFNYTQDHFTGVQWAFLFNITNEDGRYFQYASVANITGGNFRGLQLSGGLNYVNDKLSGIQAGAFNVAVEYHGAQVGIANIAGDASGAQIGLINHSTSLDGVPVGAINIDRTNGEENWSTFASNYALVSTGLRTTVHGFTSTVAVGFNDLEQERDDTIFLSWNYGYRFKLAEKAFLTPDLGWVHVMPQSSEEGKINNLHFAVQARLAGEFAVTDKMNVFVGGGVNIRFKEYDLNAKTTKDPLFFGGITLY
jgi:hypothetical protein